MTERDHARAIVGGQTLEAKLAPPPEELAVGEPGAHAPERWDAPGRPAELAIAAGRDARVPPLAGMRDPRQRVRILHALANHELQAMNLVRVGGVVAYVVCSPHLSETIGVVGDVVRKTKAEQLDAREFFPGVPDLGDGPDVQLWPHLHGTDAMYLAMIRKI
jgi:hypothetical protein